MNVLRKYWNMVYIYVLVLIPALCTSAATYWTTARLAGEYSDVEWYKIITFDGSQIIYILLAAYGIHKNRKDSQFLISRLKILKIIVSCVCFMQYIFIISLFQTVYVWECTFLFLIAIAYFFDTKYMIINSIIYTIILWGAHIVNLEKFVPLKSENVEELLAFRIVCYTLTVFCLIVGVYFVEKFLMRTWESEQENTALLEKQVKYYKDLELLDYELRKFKHDVKNHFISMESLLKNGKKDELEKYFETLHSKFITTGVMHISGNEVVDAVMNYELSHNCNKNVKIKTYGRLPYIKSVSSIDLCTIFSNLLSNAIRAVNKCDIDNEAVLEIEFSGGNKFFRIEITNTFEDEIEYVKKNKDRNHGHGLPAIRSILKKYNGDYEIEILEEKISIKVYLPI